MAAPQCTALREINRARFKSLARVWQHCTENTSLPTSQHTAAFVCTCVPPRARILAMGESSVSVTRRTRALNDVQFLFCRHIYAERWALPCYMSLRLQRCAACLLYSNTLKESMCFCRCTQWHPVVWLFVFEKAMLNIFAQHITCAALYSLAKRS